MDMEEGTLQYSIDGVDLGCVTHDSLKSGEWFITVTFGSGAMGAKFKPVTSQKAFLIFIKVYFFILFNQFLLGRITRCIYILR